MQSGLSLFFSLLGKLFLNPVFFLLYLFYLPQIGFIPKGTNSSVLEFKKFLPFVLILFIVWSIFTYGLSSFVRSEFQTLREFGAQLGQWKWTHLVSWGITIFILNIYRTGMEGNIMGFFGFPLLILASLFQVLSSWEWFKGDVWLSLVKIHQALQTQFGQFSITGMVICVLVINPIFLHLFKDLVTKGVLSLSEIPLNALAALMTSGIIIGFWIGILWLSKIVFFNSFGFVSFMTTYFSEFNVMRSFMILCTVLYAFSMLLNYFLKNSFPGTVSAFTLFTFMIFLVSEGQLVLSLMRKT